MGELRGHLHVLQDQILNVNTPWSGMLSDMSSDLLVDFSPLDQQILQHLRRQTLTYSPQTVRIVTNVIWIRL